MRVPALIAIGAALFSLSIDCREEDTKLAKEWGESPHLSVAIDWQTPPDDRCRPIRSEEQAVSMAVAQPPCSDVAIEALKNFADRDSTAMNDLAGVDYIRAKRDDRPADFLEAFDAARHAEAATPKPDGADFNRRLCEKSLALTREPNVIARWSANLMRMLHAGDAQQVSRLVAMHPSSALRFMEEELLPGDVRAARMVAEAWTKMTGESYASDEVDAVAAADAKKLEALKRGYRALRDARLTLLPGPDDDAKAAAEGLSGTPAALYADGCLAIAHNDPAAMEAAIRRAKEAHYDAVAGWLLSGAGYLYVYKSLYLDALAKYGAAKAVYARVQDAEGLAATEVRRIGILRVLGQTDVAWRLALQTYRSRAILGSMRDRHLLAGETAAAAFILGHPYAALAYANEALWIIKEEFAETPPERIDEIHFLQANVASALRRRASYELHTGRNDLALKDLAEARRLNADESPKYQRALEARITEVEAQAYLSIDPRRAAAGFTSALALSQNLEYRSLRASLFAQRSDAERRAGLKEAAEGDLVAALAELNAEETQLLDGRTPTKADEIVWSAYFSRFQDTYRILIRQLIETGRGSQAFVYADRARAFEPLNLALKLAPATAPLKSDLASIQKILPADTFLIEYTALADRTYAWIVSHDAWQVLALPAKEADLERWNNALLRAVPAIDTTTLDATMFAAYDKLLTLPINTVARMPGGAHPRIVFIPDGAMYGLPFAALRNPITRSYVIEDAAVSSAGSAALYALSLQRDAALPRDPSALLIGNPRNDLPGAEDEVARIFSSYAPQATKHTGPSATARDFLAEISSNAIVHLAAHAVIDRQTPSRSSLLFADRALDASELLEQLQRGRTRLVVLAACSSAGGLPAGAQGVGPLVRPLIAKGIPAVIGSLWDVNDATAAPLLVSFHQHYREGDDAAVAMQKAQIELLRKENSGLQSVLAWAPFQVIGYASSPFAARR